MLWNRLAEEQHLGSHPCLPCDHRGESFACKLSLLPVNHIVASIACRYRYLRHYRHWKSTEPRGPCKNQPDLPSQHNRHKPPILSLVLVRRNQLALLVYANSRLHDLGLKTINFVICRSAPVSKIRRKFQRKYAIGADFAELDNAVFEACERRLVLSAQLMFDVLGDQALDLHGAMPEPQINDSIPLDLHVNEAAARGWNSVQQEFGLTGRGQTVAVIDSGIAWDHVALGKGFGPGYRVVGGWDFTEENDARPYDDGPLGFHGTHVSGIIGSDDSSHPGVAPEVDFVALRVFNDAGQGQLSWVERALQWVHENRNAFENPITTVNLSLGTTWNADAIPNWATLEEEFRSLYNDGIVVTASAGNSFQTYLQPGLSYPAASPYVLPVASVDDHGYLSNFSQRNSHVIAAPGENIVSTVPDHVLGRDGKIDDFTAASGTSMAAPYVAGASVLVRQAMEMVGYAGINLTSIANHLRDTADSVFDSVTGASYDRLNLQNAIDSLIPDDNIGNTWQSAAAHDLGVKRIDGWINSLGDQDVYRFTANANGTLRLDANSAWLDSLQWSLQSSTGVLVANGGTEATVAQLVAGQTYNLVVSAGREIGSFDFDFLYSPNSANGSTSEGSNPTLPVGAPTNLGQVDYLEQDVAAGKYLRVQAMHDGVFTVQWTNPDAATGSLTVLKSAGKWETGASWDSGSLRVDVPAQAGQWFELLLPGQSSDTGELTIANVLSQSGSNLTIHGTHGSDEFGVNLQSGVQVRIGEIEYAFANGAISNVSVDGHGGNDQARVIGSNALDKVDLMPDASSIENNHVRIALASIEQVDFNSGGGADRVYLYDSDGDDTLTARPRSAELVGVGYRFGVTDVDRIFIHATGGGEDFAYLYDSAGDDRLSVRPQFSSMTGTGFFNYVRGFERVYAYANAGGIDQAELYDSAGNDRFSTSGASASIVGPGFSSFTRSFEQVRASADAGGADIATLYGSSAQTQWEQGSDFISFREDGMVREARGFQAVETFVAGQSHSLSAAATSNMASQSFSALGISEVEASDEISLPTPGVAAPSSQDLSFFAAHDRMESVLESLEYLQTTEQERVEPLLAETRVLSESRQMADWLTERLLLPEEEFMSDPAKELALLDEVFSRFSRD